MYIEEGFDTSDDNIKPKGRRRKKLLFKTVCEQMEFYFSDANLSKDRFLRQMVENDPCESCLGNVTMFIIVYVFFFSLNVNIPCRYSFGSIFKIQ